MMIGDRPLADYVESLKETAGYCWARSVGAGSRGDVRDNGLVEDLSRNVFDPKSEHFNLTAASKLIQSRPETARRMQLAAGLIPK